MLRGITLLILLSVAAGILKPAKAQEGNTTSNRETAVRFIEAFNTDDWDTVREVVAADFVFHHPAGGTVQAGPEGMVAAWSGFKAALPDSWHPIPIMIAEGDWLAVLLPTYGTFDGQPYHGIQPNNAFVEYGMVNIARFEDGKIAEMWFGMDPAVEMMEMGAVPRLPIVPAMSAEEKAHVALVDEWLDEEKMLTAEGRSALKADFLTDSATFKAENVRVFDERVMVCGEWHNGKETGRAVGTLTVQDGALAGGSWEVGLSPDQAVDGVDSRAVVDAYIAALNAQDFAALAGLLDPNLLVHPTGMPCEMGYLGIEGHRVWLEQHLVAFPDLQWAIEVSVAEGDIVALHYSARGTSEGRFLVAPPSGETVQFTGSTLYRVKDGRIVEIWETRNTGTIMQQLMPGAAGSHSH